MLGRQQGFSYLLALFMVAIVAVLSARGIESTAMRERRAKEAELLYVGQVYRTAIKSYYDNTPGTSKRYPANLSVLLEDDRTSRLNRHLRQLYLDPITRSANWGVVEAPGGGIMGVYSLSMAEPIKTDGFPIELANFLHATKYQDWKFIYQPN